MNRDRPRPPVFVPLHRAAALVGVPSAWLRTEAEAGRIPSLRAGRRVLFSVSLVRRALLARVGRAATGETAG